MSIDRQGHRGDVIFICDGDRCHEHIDTGTDDFAEAREVMKGAGWKIRKVVGEWMHFCRDCEP